MRNLEIVRDDWFSEIWKEDRHLNGVCLKTNDKYKNFWSLHILLTIVRIKRRARLLQLVQKYIFFVIHVAHAQMQLRLNGSKSEQE